MPCIYDATKTISFDSHYIYHPAWAAKIIAKTKPKVHHDFSSILSFSTVLSAFVNVEFYDFRPAKVILDNYKQGFADLLHLPFPDNSLESISCMHTIEHIGLGRYGDKIDPNGDLKALSELQRVLKSDGNLLLVVPIGKSRIMFNGQRIYNHEQIESLLIEFTIIEFSMVPDDYNEGMINFPSKALINEQNFACGCFWLKKKLNDS
jgi:SAM-dependent methyltransferase